MVLGAEKIKNSVLDILVLRCSFDIQMELSIRQLDLRKELGRNTQAGYFNLG